MTPTCSGAGPGGAKVFTKLDATSGFWQIPLSTDSSLLTSFLIPFGRYCFNRLPFGITSAPKHFQQRMSALLDELDGVMCMVDDVLVRRKNQDKHDHLINILQCSEVSGLMLNKEKCNFSERSEISWSDGGQVRSSPGPRGAEC